MAVTRGRAGGAAGGGGGAATPVVREGRRGLVDDLQGLMRSCDEVVQIVILFRVQYGILF